MKKLSIIIVTFGNPDMVRDCIQSIYENNDLLSEEIEIIISDNTLDDSIAKLIFTEFPDLTFVKNENVGFGKGNNIGFSHAAGEYVLFLNPDTIICNKIFKRAIANFEQDNELGLLGVRTLNAEKKKTISYGMRVEKTRLPIVLSNLTLKVSNKINYFNQNKMFPYGAALFMPRNVFIKIGKFDENIFMYFEEADLVRRVRQAKLKIKFDNKIQLIHLCGKSSVNKFSQEKKRIEAFAYYVNKYDISNKVFNRYMNQLISLIKIKNFIKPITNYKEYISLYDSFKKDC